MNTQSTQVVNVINEISSRIAARGQRGGLHSLMDLPVVNDNPKGLEYPLRRVQSILTACIRNSADVPACLTNGFVTQLSKDGEPAFYNFSSEFDLLDLVNRFNDDPVTVQFLDPENPDGKYQQFTFNLPNGFSAFTDEVTLDKVEQILKQVVDTAPDKEAAMALVAKYRDDMRVDIKQITTKYKKEDGRVVEKHQCIPTVVADCIYMQPVKKVSFLCYITKTETGWQRVLLGYCPNTWTGALKAEDRCQIAKVAGGDVSKIDLGEDWGQ